MIKDTLVLALSLAIVALLRRATASTRHSILVAGQLAALVVPLLTMAVPPIAVPVQPPVAADTGTFIDVIPAAAPASGVPAQAPIDWTLLLWAAGCAAVLFLRATSLFRAASIVRNAAPFGDVWISEEVDQPSTLGRAIVLPAAAVKWDGRS